MIDEDDDRIIPGGAQHTYTQPFSTRGMPYRQRYGLNSGSILPIGWIVKNGHSVLTTTDPIFSEHVDEHVDHT